MAYEKVGAVGVPADDVPLPAAWNPPGWASVSNLEGLAAQYGALLPHRWRAAMIVTIRPGGFIPFHRDDPATENALDVPLRRYHVVLATNAHCWNFHDGAWQQLEAGGVYMMDPSREHASINLGTTMRAHLVVDVETPCQKAPTRS